MKTTNNSKARKMEKTNSHLLFLSNLLISKGVTVLLDALKNIKIKNILLFVSLLVEKHQRWVQYSFQKKWINGI